MLTVAAVPIYHLLVKPAKPADEKPPLRRGSSILEELTSAPLILRVVMWLQIFQGLLAWLAPKLFVAIYGVVEISRTDEMLCENWGRVWLALHAGALVGRAPVADGEADVNGRCEEERRGRDERERRERVENPLAPRLGREALLLVLNERVHDLYGLVLRAPVAFPLVIPGRYPSLSRAPSSRSARWPSAASR